MEIIAVLWRYGDWRHVTTGCTALVTLNVTDNRTSVVNHRDHRSLSM